MANSRHYKWQAQWAVDGSVARHTSGVMVTPTGRMVAPDEVVSAMTQKHGGHNTPQVLDRLVREALAIWHAHAAGIPQRHAKIVASSKS